MRSTSAFEPFVTTKPPHFQTPSLFTSPEEMLFVLFSCRLPGSNKSRQNRKNFDRRTFQGLRQGSQTGFEPLATCSGQVWFCLRQSL